MAFGAARAFIATVIVSLPIGAARGVADDAGAKAAPEPAFLTARRKGTADADVDAAVRAALDWLLRHRIQGGQDDGGWTLDGFPKRCVGPRCGGVGIDYAGHVAPTALALLALLGAGETPTQGKHREAVSTAMGVLLRSQGADGCFGPRSFRAFLVAHAAATSAVAEAYWATKDSALRGPLTKGRDFLLAAQNAGSGWGYEWNPPAGDDTFMTASASLALRTVEFAGVEVSRKSRDGALTWLDRITDPATGRTGYATWGGCDARLAEIVRDSAPAAGLRVAPIRGFRTEGDSPVDTPARLSGGTGSTMTAAAALVRALQGGDSTAVAAGARFVEGAPRFGRANVNLHYALFGSLLFAQTGGGAEWRKAAVAAMLSSQQPSTCGCAAGSFDPDLDPWGAVGGRVYATAMAALALQAPTRFPRVYDPKSGKASPPKKR